MVCLPRPLTGGRSRVASPRGRAAWPLIPAYDLSEDAMTQRPPPLPCPGLRAASSPISWNSLVTVTEKRVASLGGRRRRFTWWKIFCRKEWEGVEEGEIEIRRRLNKVLSPLRLQCGGSL